MGFVCCVLCSCVYVRLGGGREVLILCFVIMFLLLLVVINEFFRYVLKSVLWFLVLLGVSFL